MSETCSVAGKATAPHDVLTGLETRQPFLKAIDERLAEAAEKETSVSLALVDIDWFKKVNDEHGHAVGDAVIKRIASHLIALIPGSGAVYRYGGEEFAILLPETEKEAAFLHVEGARRAFENASGQVFEADGKECAVDVTFSTGVATCPDDATGAKDLIRKADEALYRAKATGRNKVVLARQEKMVTKTSYYTQSQLERLSLVAKREGVGEAMLLREALDDLLRKLLVREV